MRKGKITCARDGIGIRPCLRNKFLWVQVPPRIPREVYMKRVSTLVGISCISVTAFAIMRTVLVSARGVSTFGGEALLLIIPLIAWLTFKNIDLTKKEIQEEKLSREAENASCIKVEDHDGAIQITDIHVIN